MINKTLHLIKWLAKITGTIVLAFLLFFIVAHLIGAEENRVGFRDAEDMLTFVLFPVCPVVGLLIAYKWNLAGGLISTGAMLVLFLMRPDLWHGVYVVLSGVPGLLYLISALMVKRSKSVTAST